MPAGSDVAQWGKANLTWIWKGQILKRLVSVALLCGQIGVLCAIVVAVLNFLAEIVELLSEKRRTVA
jgi:hypothetical protein